MTWLQKIKQLARFLYDSILLSEKKVNMNEKFNQAHEYHGHCSPSISNTQGGYTHPSVVIHEMPIPGGKSLDHKIKQTIKFAGDNQKGSFYFMGKESSDVFYVTSAGKTIPVLNKEMIDRLENGQAIVINTCQNDEDKGVI